MKTLLLPFMGCLVMSACVADKQIQAEIIYVQLVRIDTVNRFRSEAKQLEPRQLLTWQDENKIDYVTDEPLSNRYQLGSRIKMMVRR